MGVSEESRALPFDRQLIWYGRFTPVQGWPGKAEPMPRQIPRCDERTGLDGGLGGLDLSCCDEAGEVVGNEIESFFSSVGSPSFFSSLYR